MLCEGICHEKTSAPKYSSLYGSSNFTSTSLHCDRVSPTVCSEPYYWVDSFVSSFWLQFVVLCHKVLSWADYYCFHLYFITSVEVCVVCYTKLHPNLTGDDEYIWPWILWVFAKMNHLLDDIYLFTLNKVISLLWCRCFWWNSTLLETYIPLVSQKEPLSQCVNVKQCCILTVYFFTGTRRKLSSSL